MEPLRYPAWVVSILSIHIQTAYKIKSLCIATATGADNFMVISTGPTEHYNYPIIEIK
jgi:hypothetical protein